MASNSSKFDLNDSRNHNQHHYNSPKKQKFHHNNNNNNNNNYNNNHSNNNHSNNNHSNNNHYDDQASSSSTQFKAYNNKPRLPVFKYKDAFLKLLSDNQTLVIVGETGSGKTTQIPRWCLDYCLNNKLRNQQHQTCVACTQPRRIAAMSVAARVAKEMNVELGNEVGYSVRFESSVSPQTKLKYLTDGMLLREAMLDGSLSSYNVVILDEAHERTLQTEILLGVIKRALKLRNQKSDNYNHQEADTKSSLPPLKVIIMSATIDVKLFSKYLFNSPTLMIEGRQHTVDDMFAEIQQSDLLNSTLITVFQIHRNEDEGDILVFCAGQDEILSLIKLCKSVLKQAPEHLQNLQPLPLFASLPAPKQMVVFEPNKTKKVPISPNNDKGLQLTNGFSAGNSNYSKTNGFSTPSTAKGSSTNGTSEPAFIRRVIFATNVAETSVTIPNIKFVIDTGKVKCRTYCPKTGLESLQITNISKAQASQRSGRAGRIAPGTCYRLYTDEEYANFKDHLLPEIKRCNLDGVILQMISIGIKNINQFDFLERPEDERIKAALVDLMTLKAIKVSQGKIKNNSSSKNTTNSSSKLTENQIESSTTENQSDSNQSRSSSSTKKEDSSSVVDKSKRKNVNVDMLNVSYELTNLGKKLCTFPLNPSMSRILLAANELNCLEEALTVVSFLYIENIFQYHPNRQVQADLAIEKFRSNEGDAVMFLKVFKAFKRQTLINRANIKQWCNENFINVKNMKIAQLVRKQLVELTRSMNMKSTTCGHDTSLVRRAMTYGLFNNVATMWNGKYRNKYSDEIQIHPNSCLFKLKPECILYFELVETSKCYMRNCTLIDMNWIREISAAQITTATSSKKNSD